MCLDLGWHAPFYVMMLFVSTGGRVRCKGSMDEIMSDCALICLLMCVLYMTPKCNLCRFQGALFLEHP